MPTQVQQLVVKHEEVTMGSIGGNLDVREPVMALR
jgi:hypothetical protein